MLKLGRVTTFRYATQSASNLLAFVFLVGIFSGVPLQADVEPIVLGSTALRTDSGLSCLTVGDNSSTIVVGARSGKVFIGNVESPMKETAVILLDKGEPSSVALSEDEQSVAVCIRNMVEVWRIDTRQRRLVFSPYQDDRYVSLGGNRLVAYTQANLAVAGWICNSDTGKRLKQYGAAGAVAASANGLLASAGGSNIEPFRITNLDTFNKLDLYDRWPTSLSAMPSSFDFDAADKRLAVGFYSTGGGAEIVDVENPKNRRTMKDVRGWVMGVDFSPNGKMLAGAAYARAVYLWDASTGEVIHRLDTPDRNNLAVAFSPNGKSVWAIGTDHRIRVWRSDDGKPLYQDDGHSYGIMDISVSPDGKVIASIDSHHFVHLWDAAEGERIAVLPRLRNLPNKGAKLSLDFSPNGKQLAVCGNVVPSSNRPDDFMEATRIGLGKVQVFDVESATLSAAYAAHPLNVELVRYSPDKETIASYGSNSMSPRQTQELQLLNAATGLLEKSIPVAGPRLYGFDYSSDGEFLATACWLRYADIDNQDVPSTIEIWNTERAVPIRSLAAHAGAINSIRFKPNSTVFATCGTDQKVLVWSEDSDKPVQVLEGHSQPAYSIAYSPDGLVLASGSRDETIVLWNTETGRKLATLKGHRGAVTALEFLPDGRLVSGSMDTTVMIWDVQKFGELGSE